MSREEIERTLFVAEVTAKANEDVGTKVYKSHL